MFPSVWIIPCKHYTQIVEQKKELEEEASDLRIELLQKEELEYLEGQEGSSRSTGQGDVECGAVRKSRPQVTKEELARLREFETRLQCPVCMDRLRDCALRPCGHAFCQQCVNELVRPRCPLCREFIFAKLPIFL